MRNPRDFGKALAIGAPTPVTEIPFKPSRMIHFLDFSNEKMVAKVPDIAPQVDILLGNLEDAVPVDKKEAAREGLITVGRIDDMIAPIVWLLNNPEERHKIEPPDPDKLSAYQWKRCAALQRDLYRDLLGIVAAP